LTVPPLPGNGVALNTILVCELFRKSWIKGERKMVDG
jgi:hypothetical protein